METMGKTEINVESIHAYDKGVQGCKRHNKDVMIAYKSADKEKDGDDIIDLFLSQSEAEHLLERLTLAIKTNKES